MVHFLSLLISVVAVAAVPFVPSIRDTNHYVFANSLSYGGSGCPEGSVTYELSENYEYFTITFSRLSVSIYGDLNILSKFCTISVGVTAPQGISLAVATMDARGSVILDSGVNATLSQAFYFSGSPVQASGEIDFYGQVSIPNFVATARFGVVAYSPCGGDFLFNFQTTVEVAKTPNTPGDGTLADYSEDGTIQLIIPISYLNCTAP